MKHLWRILPAFAISLSVAEPSLANDGQSMKSERYPAVHEGGQKSAQAETAADKWPIKPSSEHYTWTASDENYKWALPSPAAAAAAADKQAASVKPESNKKPASYFVPSSSYSTQPESDPPRYVRNLSKTGIEAFKDITWLDVGLDHRTRYEFRSNDIRRTRFLIDEPFLLRTRGYLGVKEILDPLRGAVEFQDSRRYNGHFPHDDRDFNEFELIQAYGELYFRGALGEDAREQQRPIRFRAGRMAYEALDRRLIGRNEWRNTTNTFEGFRINLGQEANNWEIDTWAYQPVKRLLTEFDQRI
ncbi:MAG: alginate export family protein, partial [Nitrosospira sp.]|nr:alginate export family protein [Nitrosospira sp.]